MAPAAIPRTRHRPRRRSRGGPSMAWVTISPYPPRRGGCATVGLDGCGLELKRKAEPGYPRELLPREANLIRSTRASPSASLRIRSARPWSSQGPPRRAAPRRKARWRTCRVNPESASWASANEPSPSSRATRTLRRAHSRAAAPTPGLVPHTSHPPLDPCPRLRRRGTRGGWYRPHISLCTAKTPRSTVWPHDAGEMFS